MDSKFSKNDMVVYGNNGICTVEDIRIMKFGKDEAVYYVLKPKASSAATLYVPQDKESLVSKMRKLLTREEIDNILHSDVKKLSWPENRLERADLFGEILSRCNTGELLMMIKCIHLKRNEKLSQGKSLSASDENFLRVAEKLINEEFSFCLGCTDDEVKEYIKTKMNN